MESKGTRDFMKKLFIQILRLESDGPSDVPFQNKFFICWIKCGKIILYLLSVICINPNCLVSGAFSLGWLFNAWQVIYGYY